MLCSVLNVDVEICSNTMPDNTGFPFCEKDHSYEVESKKIKLFFFDSPAKGFQRTDNDGTCSLGPSGALQRRWLRWTVDTL